MNKIVQIVIVNESERNWPTLYALDNRGNIYYKTLFQSKEIWKLENTSSDIFEQAEDK